MSESGKTFYSLSYSHNEIEQLLRKIASGNVLKADDYDKLINIIGLDNISTFSGNYNDLENTPNIPYWTSDLKDDLDLAKRDYVDREIDIVYDRLVSLINEYENENEGIFANQSDIDKKLEEIEVNLKSYINQQIRLLPIDSFATKTELRTDLLSKSDVGHTHKITDITELQKALTTFEVKFNLLDKEYASKINEHIHDNKEALDMITKGQVEKWNAYDDKVQEFLTRIDGIRETTEAQIDVVLKTVDDQMDDVRSEHNELLGRLFELEELRFKTEKDLITTQTVGGLDKGTNIQGLNIHSLLERILLPDIKPEATMTLNPNKTIYEKGETATIKNITVDITLGSNPIKIVKLFANGKQVQSQTPIETEGTASVVFELNDPIKSSIKEGYYRVHVEDEKGYYITIDSKAINFYYPSYYGVTSENITLDKLTENLIKGMKKKVEAKGDKSYTYTTEQQHMVYAYPKSYGELASIVDTSGFNVTGTFERKVISIDTIDGPQDYYVYMNNANTNTNFKMTFKF